MRDWPLGVKLTIWSALVVGAALTLCGFGAVYFVREEQIESLDEQLRQEARVFFHEHERRGPELDWSDRRQVKQMLPLTFRGRIVELADSGGRELYWSREPGEAHLPASAPGFTTVILGQLRIRVGVFERAGLVLRLGADIREIQGDTSALTVRYLAVLPLLLGSVAFGGWWLARQALEPVRAIATAAEQITADRLDRRLPVSRTRDEIGRLSTVLNAMFDRLDQSFRQSARFSADASHELKTPLTILRATIEDVLDSPTLSETDRAAIGTLLEQTRRLASITESLLLLSRADAGRLKLDLADADLCEIIVACTEDAGVLAEDRAITIETELPASLHVHLDAARFTQILLNLLDNAVKYNRAAGEVRVTLADGGTNWNLLIGNTGPGIAPAHRARLFERFFRGEHNTGDRGCGLGLSLARELARAHGGDVELVRSEEGWTEFAISLPKHGAGIANPALQMA